MDATKKIDRDSVGEKTQDRGVKGLAAMRMATRKPRKPRNAHWVNQLQQKERDARISSVPISKRKTMELAYATASKSMAIKAKCLECVGFESNEVRNCTAAACPLWNVRPYAGGGGV